MNNSHFWRRPCAGRLAPHFHPYGNCCAWVSTWPIENNTRHSASPSAYQPVSPSIRQPVGPSACQPVRPSVRQPAIPSVQRSLGPSARQPISPSARQSVSPPGWLTAPPFKLSRQSLHDSCITLNPTEWYSELFEMLGESGHEGGDGGITCRLIPLIPPPHSHALRPCLSVSHPLCSSVSLPLGLATSPPVDLSAPLCRLRHPRHPLSQSLARLTFENAKRHLT